MGEAATRSPRPRPARISTAEEMTFPDALRKVMDGRKITKIEWKDNNIYGCMKDDILTLHNNGKDFQWIISSGDLMGDDWIVLQEQGVIKQ